jgi:hypothetical protein
VVELVEQLEPGLELLADTGGRWLAVVWLQCLNGHTDGGELLAQGLEGLDQIGLTLGPGGNGGDELGWVKNVDWLRCSHLTPTARKNLKERLNFS